MTYVNDTNSTEVLKSVLKKLGVKIMKGELTNIMGMSKPSVLSKDFSYLEVIAL